MKPTCIALCGYPKSGNSTLQAVLEHEYGVLPFDDALVIREAAMVIYDIDWAAVSTQAGKQSQITVAGTTTTVRQLLGQLGNFLVDTHGTGFKPATALRRAERFALEKGLDSPVFSFGSVRLDEARVYREAGGLVVEVVRPGCSAARPEDEYERSLVDVTIHNDGTLDELRKAISSTLGPILAPGG